MSHNGIGTKTQVSNTAAKGVTSTGVAGAPERLAVVLGRPLVQAVLRSLTRHLRQPAAALPAPALPVLEHIAQTKSTVTPPEGCS